jgi:hypothetical protein
MNDIGRILIWVIVAVAIIALVWWFLQMVALPWPLVVIVYAALAVVGILFLLKLARGNLP